MPKIYDHLKIYNFYLIKLNQSNNHLIAAAAARSEFGVGERTMQRIVEKFRDEQQPEVSTPPTTTEPEPVELLKFDREKVKLKAEITQLKSKYKIAIDELENTQTELAFISDVKANLRSVLDIPYHSPKTAKTASKNEAIPFIIGSDWHFGERVDPSTVNYLNRYDPDIAEDSINKFFDRAALLTNISRQDNHIETGVLALLGDLMTGYIHDELKETNHLSPQQELLALLRILKNKIPEMCDKAGFKKLYIICTDGNHGRGQQEKLVSSRMHNSHEFLLYHLLAEELKNDKRIEFIISDSVFTYIKIWGLDIRFMHGDTLKYSGGIGGLEVPLRKALARLNSQRPAIMTFLGHFHQLIFGPEFTVNESIIGAGPYSHQFGFPARPARQAFLLLDSKRREFTARYPIFVDDGDRLQFKSEYRTSNYVSKIKQTLELK